MIVDADSYYFAIANLLEQGVPLCEVKRMIKEWLSHHDIIREEYRV